MQRVGARTTGHEVERWIKGGGVGSGGENRDEEPRVFFFFLGGVGWGGRGINGFS